MNVNRQNNCCAPVGAGFAGRPCRPPMPAPAQCSGNVVSQVPCCSDVAAGGIIIGGCQDRDCNKETTLSGMPIAMAYVPWQSYGDIYPVPQALRNGTMFRELNLDFAGRRCN